jgi:hypothetical protein
LVGRNASKTAASKASFFMLGFSISAAGPFFLLVICGGI